jgi:hypothetical protein
MLAAARLLQRLRRGGRSRVLRIPPLRTLAGRIPRGRRALHPALSEAVRRDVLGEEGEADHEDDDRQDHGDHGGGGDRRGGGALAFRCDLRETAGPSADVARAGAGPRCRRR